MLAVGDSRQLQATVLAMKAADRDLRSTINKVTRATLNPVWREEIASHLAGRSVMDSAVLGAGARVKAGNPPTALAAQSTRALGRTRRVVPAQMYYVWEFGVDRAHRATYQRRNRKTGGTHTVTRRTNTGLPARTPAGRVVYPAFAATAPRMVSLWVQTIVRAYAEAAEQNGA